MVFDGGKLTCCGDPPHQGRDSAHNGTDPGVEDGDAFEGRIDCCIEEDIES